MLLGIFQQPGQLLAEVLRPSLEAEAALQQQAAHLIDDLRTVMHQSLPHPMQALQIQLVVGLDGNKPHIVARNRFSDGFAIQVVVLVRLTIRLHELPGNQPNLMPLFAYDPSQVMRSAAGLHADQRGC